MKKPRPRKLPAPTRARLDIAAAAAQESVTQLHVERALDFVQLADGRVSAARMLDIYLRLQALPSALRTIVRNRTLATLGRGGGGSDEPFAGADADGAQLPDEDDPPSVWRTVKRRLRGRVNAELRRAVELHTGRTQRLLLETHVRQARDFIDVLGREQPVDAACARYGELVHVPPVLAAVLYALVLDRLAVEEMPRRWTSPRQQNSAAHPAAPTPLPTRKLSV
jgi:hypothetical protein